MNSIDRWIALGCVVGGAILIIVGMRNIWTKRAVGEDHQHPDDGFAWVPWGNDPRRTGKTAVSVGWGRILLGVVMAAIGGLQWALGL